MPERRENPIKRIINESPAVRGILGGVLILGGTLGAGYSVIDFGHHILRDTATEMDETKIPLPKSWSEVYNHVNEQRRNLTFIIYFDMGILLASSFGIKGGYNLLNYKRRMWY